MEYVMWQVAEGHASLDDIVSGNTLRYQIEQMIQITCNGATSRIIAHFGRGNIDTWLAENFESTRLNSDFRGLNAGGRTNSVSVAEHLELLERIFHNRHAEPYATMFDIMLNSELRDRLPEATPPDEFPNVRVATKTGSFVHESRATDHDTGIIISEDEDGNIRFAYAIVIMTYAPVQRGEPFPARTTLIGIARDIYEQFDELYP
jgi:beta-lactamase class A